MGDVLVLLTLLVGTFVVAFCAPAFLDKPKVKTAKRRIFDKLGLKESDFHIFHKEYVTETVNELGDQADELRNKHEAKEDKWIAELEEQVEILKASLITLRKEPDCTVTNKQAQLLAQNSMAMAQCTLAMLYKRRDAK